MRSFVIFLTLLSGSLFAQEMTLQECLARALKDNLDIQIQVLDTRVANQGYLSSMGIFEPSLSGEYSQRSQKNASTWSLEGADVVEQDTKSGNLVLSQLIPTGGAFSFTYSAYRSETNSFFYDVNPSYTSNLTLGFSQSLLKGFGSDVTRYQIILNANTYNTSLHQLRYRIMTSMLEVEKAYWDLDYALADLKVKEMDLELARELLEDTQKRIDLGVQAPIDIYQAQVGVATRDEAIIFAKSVVESAQDHLKNLLNITDLKEWEKDIIPVEEIVVSESSYDLEESFKRALADRPDVGMLMIDRETKKTNYLIAKNNLLPRLDLNVAYWYAGTGGDRIIRDPLTGEVEEVIPGGIDDAHEQISDRLFNNWSTALSFTVPLFNRDAKAQKQIAELYLERSDREYDQLKQEIYLSVRSSLRSLETARKSLEAAGVSRIFAEKNLDAERKKYENGMTTSFQVLEVEADLSESKTREILSRITYRKAIADYHFAIGDLPGFVGIDVVGEPTIEPSSWRDMPFLSYGWWVRGDQNLID